MKVILSPLGTITTKFGVHDATHKDHFHKGVDFACQEGAEIHSPADGIVQKIAHDNGLHEGLGNAVMIKTSDGYQLTFGHLSGLKVNSSTVIQHGDVIGLCGETGRSFGSHLHFSVRDTLGHYIDPEVWFKLKQTVTDAFM